MQGAMESAMAGRITAKIGLFPAPIFQPLSQLLHKIKRLWEGRRGRDLGRLTRRPTVDQPRFLVFFNLISICRWRAMSGRWRPYHSPRLAGRGSTANLGRVHLGSHTVPRPCPCPRSMQPPFPHWGLPRREVGV